MGKQNVFVKTDTQGNVIAVFRTNDPTAYVDGFHEYEKVSNEIDKSAASAGLAKIERTGMRRFRIKKRDEKDLQRQRKKNLSGSIVLTNEKN